MTIAKVEGSPADARWTARIALFSLVMVLVAILMHRFLGMATPVLLALIQLALAGALVALVLGLIAGVRIWRRGGAGSARVVVGVVVALGLLAWPLSLLPQLRALPMINDVTTSPADPPAFLALAARRIPPANGPAYPGGDFPALQKAAYPDLKTVAVNRSVEETYDVVLEAVRRQRYVIVRDEPPTQENQRAGRIEAVDRTLVIGFPDDVAIRVTGGDGRAAVDLRSASRYGRHDFGRNAERLRTLLNEIVAQLEATVSGAGRTPRGNRAAPPSERRGAGRTSEDRRR